MGDFDLIDTGLFRSAMQTDTRTKVTIGGEGDLTSGVWEALVREAQRRFGDNGRIVVNGRNACDIFRMADGGYEPTWPAFKRPM